MKDLDAFVLKWKEVVVRLATAHDKDGADRAEAAIEECLQPILRMPIAQLREFAGKLAAALEADPAVPYLVHRAYRTWIDQMKGAPDEGVKELKQALARELVEMTIDDAKRDLADAMVLALMWRSPAKLEEVKAEVVKAKASGGSVRLKGRESCLFLEVIPEGAEVPVVCVQV